MTTNPIEETLVDVRRAFRLLHDYQRCSLDLVRYISTQLGFLESNGVPVFTDRPPSRDKIDLGASAWNWLNMFFYDFYFDRAEENLRLSIWLISDTGFYTSSHSAPRDTDVRTFAPAEQSGTKLGFLLYRSWPERFADRMSERDVMRQFIENDGKLPPELQAAGILGKCCDFAECRDRRSTDAVIDDLVARAKRRKLPLVQIRKAA